MIHYLLYTFIFVFSSTTYADTYYKGTIVYVNGKSRTGLIESTLGTDYILFKNSEKENVEKIEAATLSRVIITVKDEVKEYHLLKIYLAWSQKRIGGPMWLKVVEKGIATLYVNQTSLSTPSNSMNSAGFLDYYCIRAGEPAAKWISAVSTLNNNQHFRAKAPQYFEDYPELAEKIKSKVYTWKEITIVVQEYNRWAAMNK